MFKRNPWGYDIINNSIVIGIHVIGIFTGGGGGVAMVQRHWGPPNLAPGHPLLITWIDINSNSSMDK